MPPVRGVPCHAHLTLINRFHLIKIEFIPWRPWREANALPRLPPVSSRLLRPASAWPASIGLRPASIGLRPASIGLRPASIGLRPASIGLESPVQFHREPESAVMMMMMMVVVAMMMMVAVMVMMMMMVTAMVGHLPRIPPPLARIWNAQAGRKGKENQLRTLGIGDGRRLTSRR